MFLKKLLYVILLILFTFSCDETEIDCSTVSCAGPQFIALELLLDGENVFLNETYTIEDIRLLGSNSSDFTLFLSSFDTMEDDSILFLELSSFRASNFMFSLDLGTEFLIDFDAQTELTSSEGCCGGIPFYTSVKINGVEQELPDTFDLNFTINLN
ncbi:MAG: hypothetical protein AAGC43_11055 [Bacteroidota bacterium]